jgi:hypothetical protein
MSNFEITCLLIHAIYYFGEQERMREKEKIANYERIELAKASVTNNPKQSTS